MTLRSASTCTFVACLAVAAMGCAAEEPGCTVAPLSQVVLYDKLDFQGLWEHRATVVGSEGVEGATTEPRTVT